jgi:hypothetical protein
MMFKDRRETYFPDTHMGKKIIFSFHAERHKHSIYQSHTHTHTHTHTHLPRKKILDSLTSIREEKHNQDRLLGD